MRLWLQVFRAPTWPLTLLAAIVPYLAAGGEPLLGSAVAALTVPLHFFSFGLNSLQDATVAYELGKPPPDLADPSKRHHPIVSGDIPAPLARNVILGGLCATCSGMAALTLLAASNPTLAFASLLFYFVFGFAYNDGCSKTTRFSFLFPAASFSGLSLWGWFVASPELQPEGALIAAYVALSSAFEIGFAGSLKDIEADRVNLLKSLGARVSGGRIEMGRSWAFALPVKLASLAVACALALRAEGLRLLFNLAWLSALSAAVLALLVKLLSGRPYDREADVRALSRLELASVALFLPLALGPVAGFSLLALGAAYYRLSNRYVWGSDVPRV